MASVQIQALLRGPSREDAEARTLKFLDTTFPSLQHLQAGDSLEAATQQAKQQSDDTQAELTQSQQAVDRLIADTRASTREQLHTAQELSLLRHSLSDELAFLSQQLVSSLERPDGEPTLLEDLETFHRTLKELESVKSYVQVIERSLQLSEAAVQEIQSSPSLSSVSQYEALQRFVGTVQEVSGVAENVGGQQQLHIISFLNSVKDKTWSGMKNVLSSLLLSAADKLHWPMQVDYLAASSEDRKAFEAAFLNMLKLQSRGDKLHSTSKAKKEELYPIQALVQPVSLRFKYHFEGTRQTNRLDKPEWYFTHVLNVSHEHRAFMENVVQTIYSKTEYRHIDAWREFTLLLLPMLERKLRKTVPALLAHPAILAHTIYEALAFDTSLREQGFELGGTSAEDASALDAAKAEKWPGISDVILGRKEWFDAWMEGERQFAMNQYMEIISSSDAWLVADENDEEDSTLISDRDLKPTVSARRVKALVEQVTDRYSPLPQFSHRTRFLISVQLPILESYHSRISSSLDAFETLSSSFMRAVPGALGSDVSGRDPKRLTSGVEGVQRLCKAYISAKYIAAACEAWGEDLFFLELWAEINRRASLRSRVEAAAALPDPKSKEDDTEPPEGTIFEELVTLYSKLAGRAEELIVQSVAGEVESGLKAHFTGGSTQVTPNPNPSAQDDISLAPTLLGPIALLSSHLSFLQSTLPQKSVISLYRRIASHLSSHILQRQILYRGYGRLSAQEGRAILAETELWVETCQIALVRGDRARAEGPWRALLQASRLVGAEGQRWQRLVDTTLGATGDAEWEEAMLELVGVAELSREEVGQILRTRVDCDR